MAFTRSFTDLMHGSVVHTSFTRHTSRFICKVPAKHPPWQSHRYKSTVCPVFDASVAQMGWLYLAEISGEVQDMLNHCTCTGYCTRAADRAVSRSQSAALYDQLPCSKPIIKSSRTAVLLKCNFSKTAVLNLILTAIQGWRKASDAENLFSGSTDRRLSIRCWEVEGLINWI